MWKEKLFAGSQQAADIYCATHPQWGYIVPALLLGVVIGAVVALAAGYWALNKVLK